MKRSEILMALAQLYTKEVANPFYGLYANTTVARREALEDMRAEQEYEPRLDEIDSLEKLNDDYFHSDDI